jgi:hypothetical protein
MESKNSGDAKIHFFLRSSATVLLFSRKNMRRPHKIDCYLDTRLLSVFIAHYRSIMSKQITCKVVPMLRLKSTKV